MNFSLNFKPESPQLIHSSAFTVEQTGHSSLQEPCSNSNLYRRYFVHISPSLLLVPVPGRKLSLGHFCPHGLDQLRAYLRHTGYVPVSGKNSRRVLVQAFRQNTTLNRQWILNESSCGVLARDPHQYPTYAGGQVLSGNSQLNIVSSFVGARGALSCVDIHFTASLYALSPFLPSCFWHSSDPGRVQSAVASTCTPATKKQLWPGTTSLVQLKEKEGPA